MHGAATALLCPQGVATPWLQGTSRDLSWHPPELTVILPRDRRDTESKWDTLPYWLSGNLGMGIALWGRTCPYLQPFLAAWLAQL